MALSIVYTWNQIIMVAHEFCTCDDGMVLAVTGDDDIPVASFYYSRIQNGRPLPYSALSRNTGERCMLCIYMLVELIFAKTLDRCQVGMATEFMPVVWPKRGRVTGRGK